MIYVLLFLVSLQLIFAYFKVIFQLDVPVEALVFLIISTL